MAYCRFLISGCVLLFASAGCGGPESGAGSSSWGAAVVVPDGGVEGGGGGYTGHQGQLLLGFNNPDIRNMKLPTVTAAHVIDAGQLVADGLAGRDFIGVALQFTGLAGATVAVRIADVFSPDQTGGGWQYALEEQDASGAWHPACATPNPIVPGDPVSSPPRAIAMNGVWDGDGLYEADADNVAFACETGAVAKCAAWGYPVSATPPSVTENGLPTTVTGADMAQACTRMARADYCALGVPNTLEGTPIRYDDIFRTPPEAPDFRFEAAWPGVALTHGHPVVRPTPLCLSKLRWATLPLGGGCGVQLPDPRTDVKGEFCEDFTARQLEQMGALLYSSSSFLDVGLYSYVITSTHTTLTTASLVPAAVGQPAVWKVPPPEHVTFPSPDAAVRFEATIFAPQLPSSVPQAGLMMLTSYLCNNSDLVTTTSAPPAGCTKIADEGKVYAPNTPGHTPLRRWTDATGHHSYTTAIAPTTMMANPLRLAEVVGGVLRAAIDLNVRWSSLAGATTSLDIQTRTGQWIAPCVTNAGSRWVYTGTCPSANSRAVNRADIAALRINSTTAAGTVSATTAYDGVDSDVYVALPGGTTTAVSVTWNDRGPGARYALSILRATGTWKSCVDSNLLANGLSHVFTGACPSAGLTFGLQSVQRIRVCTTLDGQDVCGEAPYDGVQSQLAITLP